MHRGTADHGTRRHAPFDRRSLLWWAVVLVFATILVVFGARLFRRAPAPPPDLQTPSLTR